MDKNDLTGVLAELFQENGLMNVATRQPVGAVDGENVISPFHNGIPQPVQSGTIQSAAG